MELQVCEIEGTSPDARFAINKRLNHIDKKLELHDSKIAENREMLSSIIDNFNALEGRVGSLEATMRKQVESMERSVELITALTRNTQNVQRSNAACDNEANGNAEFLTKNSDLDKKGT